MNNKQPTELRLPKHKLIMARFNQIEWWEGFPDVSSYNGYRNS
jgi:hypothetical protein